MIVFALNTIKMYIPNFKLLISACKSNSLGNRPFHTVVSISKHLCRVRPNYCYDRALPTYLKSNLFSVLPSNVTLNIRFSHQSSHVDVRENGSKQECIKQTDSEVISSPSSPSNNEDELFDNIDYYQIIGENEDSLNKFKLLLLEVEVMRQDGMKVPSKMSTEEWKELFYLTSRSQRYKYLGFLWLNEIRTLGDKRKKEKKRLANIERKAELFKELESNNHIIYGFKGSTIFLRIYETTIDTFYNNRLVQAMMFGQNLVFDCGYDNHMSRMENKLCAKQLTYVFAENRSHADPFNIHFCNFKRDGVLFQQLDKSLQKIDDPSFPINTTEEHYLKLFPKEKLVYLTPHCRTELKEFNHDDIYIIGAIVDRSNQEPVSLARAKSEGLRMANLPLDRYLDWGLGNKSLTVNQVLNILLDLRYTGDWATALKHVPQRKVRDPEKPPRDSRRKLRRGTIFQPPPFPSRR